MKHLARFDDGLAAAWAWAERFRVPRPRLHMVLPDGEPRVGRDAHGEVAELRFDPCSVHLSVFDFREALLYLVKLSFRDGAGDILLLDSSLTPPQSCRKTHILRQFMTPAPSPPNPLIPIPSHAPSSIGMNSSAPAQQGEGPRIPAGLKPMRHLGL